MKSIIDRATWAINDASTPAESLRELLVETLAKLALAERTVVARERTIMAVHKQTDVLRPIDATPPRKARQLKERRSETRLKAVPAVDDTEDLRTMSKRDTIPAPAPCVEDEEPVGYVLTAKAVAK